MSILKNKAEEPQKTFEGKKVQEKRTTRFNLTQETGEGKRGRVSATWQIKIEEKGVAGGNELGRQRKDMEWHEGTVSSGLLA